MLEGAGRLLEGGARCAIPGVDVSWFDEEDWTPAAESAVRMFCHSCPVVEECGEIIARPGSYFSGVAGGWVWREGRKCRKPFRLETKEDQLMRERMSKCL